MLLSCCLKSNALSRDVPNALANSEASLSNSLNRFTKPTTIAVNPPTTRSVKLNDLSILEPNSLINVPAIEKLLAVSLLFLTKVFVLVIASSIPRASANLPKPALVKPLPTPSIVAPNTPTLLLTLSNSVLTLSKASSINLISPSFSFKAPVMFSIYVLITVNCFFSLSNAFVSALSCLVKSSLSSGPNAFDDNLSFKLCMLSSRVFLAATRLSFSCSKSFCDIVNLSFSPVIDCFKLANVFFLTSLLVISRLRILLDILYKFSNPFLAFLVSRLVLLISDTIPERELRVNSNDPLISLNDFSNNTAYCAASLVSFFNRSKLAMGISSPYTLRYKSCIRLRVSSCCFNSSAVGIVMCYLNKYKRILLFKRLRFCLR